MHDDHDILKTLRSQYSDHDLAQVAGRVLRVPEAWQALRNPAFLDEVIAASPPAHLTPSHLAGLALGGEIGGLIQPQLAAPHRSQAEQLWQQALSGQVGPRDLFEVALVGLSLAERAAKDSELIQMAAQSPLAWRSPLAVAWPALHEPERVLLDLLEAGADWLAMEVTLANLPPEEAASYLTRNAHGSGARLLLAMWRSAEADLIAALAQPRMNSASPPDAITPLLLQAASQQAAGDPKAARGALTQAWQASTGASAQVAELTADLARSEGDGVTEFEANQRALETAPTPERRARTARSLARLGRASEAVGMLVGSVQSIPEQIVAANIEFEQYGSQQAVRELRRSAVALASATRPLTHEWYLELGANLEQAEQLEAAIQVGQSRVQAHPASPAARLELARLLSAAGDWEGCSTQANLALTLAPDSSPARELLAKALDQAGEFEAALEQHRLLPNPDPKLMVQAAVRAEQLDLAGEVVEHMLTENPDSVSAHVTLGQILARKGEHGPAGAAFREALRLDPHHLEAHLALAVWQQDRGEQSAAGETLMQAAQLNPASAPAQSALAAWLEQAGRVSEAAEAAGQAVQLEPHTVEYRLQHAQILTELGHLSEARAELERAGQRAPRDWRLQLATAELLERSGEVKAAGRQLVSLPKSADAAAWLKLGRIGVQAGLDLHAAMHALSVAEDRGCEDPALHFWYARGLEQLGRHAAARERYAEALERLGPADYELREQSVLGQARCELESGNISSALELLDRAREELGGGSRLLALTAQVYQSANLSDKAVELAQAAVDADASDPTGWQALSEALAGSGEFEQAFAAAEQYNQLTPDSIQPWLEIAAQAGEADEQQLARRAMAQAVWRGRRDPAQLAHSAQHLSELGLKQPAIRVMQAAVGLGDGNAELLRKQAELLESCEEHQLAQQAWMECAELAGDDPSPLRRAAECAARLGNWTGSVALLERAQSLDPKSPGSRRRLAVAYARSGDIARSIQSFSSALREAPNDVSLALDAAEAALRAGAAREALGFVGQAQQVVTEDGRLQAALGEGYLLLNEPQQAESALAHALELGENSVRVQAMLALIRTPEPIALEALVPQSAHDAVWLARAYSRQLGFDHALQVLSEWDQDRMAALEIVRTTLRMHDAEWVLRYAEHTVQTAERPDIKPILGEQTPELEALRAWRAADRQPDGLREHIEADAAAQLGEAWIVAHLKRGDPQAALEAAARVKQLTPEAAWIDLLVGIAHEMAGQPQRARAAFRAVEGPVGPVARYLLGRSYAEAGDSERAASHIGQAVAEWMQVPAWQCRLGQIYVALDEHDSALSHFQSAAGLVPDSADYQLALAGAYRACGHLAQAEAAYETALNAGAVSAQGYRLAGQVALEMDRPAVARQRFAQALELDQEDPLVLIGAAMAAAAEGDRNAAEKHLRAAVQLDPQRPEVLLGQGEVLLQTGKSAAAMQAFEQALQGGADPATVYRAQSRLLLKQGQTEKALTPLRKALEVDPDNEASWHELALALEGQRDLAAADEAAARALKLAPRNPEYRLTLARIARRAGNLDRALEELRQARKSVPNDPRLAVEAGRVHEERREFSRALDAYREAIDMDATCLDAYYRAGLLLRTLKAYRRAGEMLKHAAELAPINSDVLHQLAAVRALELVHG